MNFELMLASYEITTLPPSACFFLNFRFATFSKLICNFFFKKSNQCFDSSSSCSFFFDRFRSIQFATFSSINSSFSIDALVLLRLNLQFSFWRNKESKEREAQAKILTCAFLGQRSGVGTSKKLKFIDF